MLVMCTELVTLCARLTGRIDPAAAAMLTYVRDDILAENKNVCEVKRLLVNMNLDYTMYYADGSRKGQPEDSLMIELADASEDVAEAVARLIKYANFQQSVLLQDIPIISRLI